MQFSLKTIATAATLLSTAQGAALLGFNYGATKSDGSIMQQSDFETLFTKAQNLVGTSGWNAARLYTSIQAQGTDPISAIPAAINTNTKLLLGLWGSAGDQTILNEISAINNAIKIHGTKFTDLVIGISVGSEDLYRVSEIGIKNKSGVGASPTDIANYIKQVKQAFAGGPLGGIKVGHVDTWTAWYNTTNQPVIDATDFIGVDAYPYFESTVANSIENGRALFDTALANVRSTTGGKEIWITETGFPVTGPVSGLSTPSTKDAKKYWDDVGCGELFNVTNTFWYTLEDNYGGALSTDGPSFGVVGSDGKELFDLSCSSVSKSPSSTASVSGSSKPTNIGGGSPAVSDLPSGVVNSASASGTGAAVIGTGSPSSTIIPITTTNSAGQTITTSMVVNGTGVATGTTMAPTASASSGPATGAAAGIAAPAAGLFGAVLAALALL